MKTLVVAPELFAHNGGIPRILRLYLRALSDMAEYPADEVGCVALNDTSIPVEALVTNGTPELRDVIGCGGSKLRFVGTVLRLARRYDRMICGHVAQLPVLLMARRLVNPRLEYYLVAHGIEVWRRYSKWESHALDAARGIWCVSAFTQGEMEQHKTFKPGQLQVLPNALDPLFPIVEHPVPPAKPPVILCVSRMLQAETYKGVEHLIRALPAVRQASPYARLRLVGRGDDVPRLHQITSDLGLDDAVEFAGFVSDADLIGEFDRCAVFALPSSGEGFGLVYLEAMARGRPCIAARAGGAQEVVTPETGILVPWGDVDAIAAACLQALQQRWSGQAIRAHVNAHALPAFTSKLAAALGQPLTPVA